MSGREKNHEDTKARRRMGSIECGVWSFVTVDEKYYVQVTVTDAYGSKSVLIEVTAVSGSTSGTIFTFR